MFNSAIEAARRRRAHGTRVPLDFVHSSRMYLFNFFVAVVFPIAVGVNLIFRNDAAWQIALGSLLLVFVAVEIGLFIRWWRRPVDPEALDERNRFREGSMFQPKQKIPPRAKW